MITVEDFTIIGGEPLLHPHCNSWVQGLRSIFDSVEDFKICTNGTVLKNIDPLWLHNWFDAGVILEIHCHSTAHWHNVWPVLQSVFAGFELVTVPFEEDPRLHRKECRLYAGGRLAAIVRISDRFLANGIVSNQKQLKFHNSDAQQAHRHCPISQCHYIVEGLMYQCAPVAVGRELAAQLPIEPRAAHLYSNYTGVSPYDENLPAALAALQQPCDACSLCPVMDTQYLQSKFVTIDPDRTKPRV